MSHTGTPVLPRQGCPLRTTTALLLAPIPGKDITTKDVPGPEWQLTCGSGNAEFELETWVWPEADETQLESEVVNGRKTNTVSLLI